MASLAKWFYPCLAQGLAKLYVLRLEGAPAADTLQGVAQVWAEALWQRQAWQPADEQRIAQAFSSLAAKNKRWPVPAELLEALPIRPIAPALPSQPSLSPQQLARNRQRLQKLISELRSK